MLRVVHRGLMKEESTWYSGYIADSLIPDHWVGILNSSRVKIECLKGIKIVEIGEILDDWVGILTSQRVKIECFQGIQISEIICRETSAAISNFEF